MFEHTDPSGTDFLAEKGALTAYQDLVDSLLIEALHDHPGTMLIHPKDMPLDAPRTVVSWTAFPRVAAQLLGLTAEEIDASRIQRQDEYVEWQVKRGADGKIQEVVFTTAFTEFYEALAGISEEAVVEAIIRLYPNDRPLTEDVFGKTSVASATERRELLRQKWADNPWVNGTKGILGLAQGSNNLSALVRLLAPCAVPIGGLASDGVCATQACVPDRNSDPVVCQTVQELARNGTLISLADPVGIMIDRLDGLWRLGAKQIDLNSPNAVWKISESKRRGVLRITEELTLNGERITSGAQVATVLKVGAIVTTNNP